MTPAKDKPAPESTPTVEPETKPKRHTTEALAQFNTVYSVIDEAGDEGLTLKAISEATGLRYRVVHNVTWRMEGSPEIKRDGGKVPFGEPRKPAEVQIRRVPDTGRSVRYAAL